jgi:hypothetical protein
MRRIVAAILTFWWIALAGGAVAFAHDLQHARDDAAAIQNAQSQNKPIPEQTTHDETNCAIHAQLHAPHAAAGYQPILIATGEWVRFLSELPVSLKTHEAFDHIRSRGPPK